MQCSKVNLTASALPTFLWARDPPGEDYDNNNIFEGMFDGYLLEQVSILFVAVLDWYLFIY